MGIKIDVFLYLRIQGCTTMKITLGKIAEVKD